MGVKLGVKGELVFDNKDKCINFMRKFGIDLDSGKKESEGIRVIETSEREGRCHVRFEGRADWPSKGAPSDVDPLDWLESQLIGLVWDVEELKTLEVYRVREDIRFEFYEDEELERKRQEYNKWWIDSASNIVGLF
ncbi:MAG: hypothetical protein NZ992_00545 [Candidatus Korarchaeum sp.]|nr:hypothetical protein [Candidatus Korarchaeum sp.]MDW8035856.1 hypothetical protein [Candidatus Korarchaeum sp.]